MQFMLSHNPANKRCPICRSHFEKYIFYRWTPNHMREKHHGFIQFMYPFVSDEGFTEPRVIYYRSTWSLSPRLLWYDLDETLSHVEIMPITSNIRCEKQWSKEKRLERASFNSKKRKKRSGFAGAYRYGRGKQKRNWGRRNPRKGNMRREKRFTGKMRR